MLPCYKATSVSVPTSNLIPSELPTPINTLGDYAVVGLYLPATRTRQAIFLCESLPEPLPPLLSRALRAPAYVLSFVDMRTTPQLDLMLAECKKCAFRFFHIKK